MWPLGHFTVAVNSRIRRLGPAGATKPRPPPRGPPSAWIEAAFLTIVSSLPVEAAIYFNLWHQSLERSRHTAQLGPGAPVVIIDINVLPIKSGNIHVDFMMLPASGAAG